MHFLSLTLTLATIAASPSPPPVNLPPPSHSCAFIVGAAQVQGKPLTPDTLGILYAASIRAQGVADTGSKLTAQQMVQAFSDLMNCFVAAPTKP